MPTAGTLRGSRGSWMQLSRMHQAGIKPKLSCWAFCSHITVLSCGARSACKMILPSKDKTGYSDLLPLGLFMHACISVYPNSSSASLLSRHSISGSIHAPLTQALDHAYPLARRQGAELCRTEVLKAFCWAVGFPRSLDCNSHEELH